MLTGRAVKHPLGHRAPAAEADHAPGPGPSASRTTTLSIGYCVAALGLLVATIGSLALGTRGISLASVVDALFDPDRANNDHMVLRELRIPRTLIGLAAGAALGLAGTVMQGVTRNPIADPGLLGVNAGASLLVVIAARWFHVTNPSGYVWFAFGGASAAAVVVYGVSCIGRDGATPVKLALAGAALTAATTSVITLLLLTDLDTLNQYRFWSVGSLVGRDLDTLGAVLPFLLGGAVLAATLGRALNVLSLGDDLARGLGHGLGRARATAALAVVLLCGSATALAGPIVFVGLVVPHLARRITGPDYRWMLLYSTLLGPTLLLASDVVGRLVVQPGELEVGLVVAMLGAPVMIAIVRRTTAAGL